MLGTNKTCTIYFITFKISCMTVQNAVNECKVIVKSFHTNNQD
jgi:hypothetical protein